MDSKQKTNQYRLVILPLHYSLSTITRRDHNAVWKFVNATAGRIFSKESVLLLKSMLPTRPICVSMAWAFLELVNMEHRILERLNRQDSARSTSELEDETLKSIHACKMPHKDALQNLQDDLFGSLDHQVMRHGFFVEQPAAKPQRSFPTQLPKAWELFSKDPRYRTSYSSQQVQSHQTEAVILLDETDRYAGHVYTWISYPTSFLYVVGIRTSLLNLACRNLSQVALKLFQGVIWLAGQHKRPFVTVLNPLASMQKVLPTIGFVHRVANGTGWVALTTHAEEQLAKSGHKVRDSGVSIEYFDDCMPARLAQVVKNGYTREMLEQNVDHIIKEQRWDPKEKKELVRYVSALIDSAPHEWLSLSGRDLMWLQQQHRETDPFQTKLLRLLPLKNYVE